MKRRTRINYTTEQKVIIWDRKEGHQLRSKREERTLG